MYNKKDDQKNIKSDIGGRRNFQQLLKLKMIREDRRGNDSKNYLFKRCQQTFSPVDECLKTFVLKKTKLFEVLRKSSRNIINTEQSTNTLLTSIKHQEQTLTPKHKLFKEVRYKCRIASQPSQNMMHPGHIQNIRNIQDQFLKAKELLVHRRTKGKCQGLSLQSKGKGITPLSPSNLSDKGRLLYFGTIDRGIVSSEQREQLKRRSRYNEIPISEFLYENGRRQQQTNINLEKKLEIICGRSGRQSDRRSSREKQL